MKRDEWNARYAAEELLWGSEPNAFLVQEVADLEPGRALDLGSGEGRNAIWLAHQGWNVTGIDFSEVAISRARRRSEGLNVEWIVADLLACTPPPNSFDLVLIFYVHLPPDQRRSVIGKAISALVSGGTLLMMAHHLDNLEHGYGGPQDAMILPTESDLVNDACETADRATLEIVKAARVLRSVDTPDGVRTAIDALVRIVRN